LNDFLNEIHQIACWEPSIVERIDQDLDLHAKKKQLLRLADAQFLAGQTPDFLKGLQSDSFQFLLHGDLSAPKFRSSASQIGQSNQIRLVSVQ